MPPNRQNHYHHHPEAFKTVHFARRANAIDFLEQNETKAKVISMVLDREEGIVLSSLPQEYFRRYNRALTYTGKLHEDLDKHLPNAFITTKLGTGPLTIRTRSQESTKISAEKPQWMNPYGPLPLPETHELYNRVNKHYEEAIDFDREERPRYVGGSNVRRKNSAEKPRTSLNDSQNQYLHGEIRIINKNYNKHYRHHKKFEEVIHMEDNGGFGESSKWMNSYSFPPQHDLQHLDNYCLQHTVRSHPPPPPHHLEPYDTNYVDHYPNLYPQYHDHYPYSYSIQHDRRNSGGGSCNPLPIPQPQQPQLPEFPFPEPYIKAENPEERRTSSNYSPKNKSSPSASNDNEQSNQPPDCQLITTSKEDEEIVEATMERGEREATMRRDEREATMERDATMRREERDATMRREERDATMRWVEQDAAMRLEEQDAAMRREEQDAAMRLEEQDATMRWEEQDATMRRGEQDATMRRGEQDDTMEWEEQDDTMRREKLDDTMRREKQDTTTEQEVTQDVQSDKSCTGSGFKKYKELLSGELRRPVFVRKGDAPNLSELQRAVLELLFL